MKKISTVLLGVILLLGCNMAKTNGINSNNEKGGSSKSAVATMQTDTTFVFSNCKADKIPVGWSQYFTGKGEKTEWKIVDDNGNKVLAQLSKNNPNYHFNVIVFNDFEAKNVELTVKLKGVSGKMDRGGGFVWRFIDADNYYVVRANPLEDNVVLYKVVNGKRTDLPLIGKGKTYGIDVEPLGNGWNTLKLTVLDNLFTVYLNNKQLFQVKDDTFKKTGKIGLWTKADAVSYFDDLQVVKGSQ